VSEKAAAETVRELKRGEDDCIDDPAAQARRVSGLMGEQLDTEATAVEPELYRHREKGWQNHEERRGIGNNQHSTPNIQRPRRGRRGMTRYPSTQVAKGAEGAEEGGGRRGETESLDTESLEASAEGRERALV